MSRLLLVLAALTSVGALVAVVSAPDDPVAARLTSAPAPATVPCSGPTLHGHPLPEAASPQTEPPEIIEEEIELRWIDPADAPPDPVETGDCSLVLELTSDADGTPCATRFELWRIGEPGNQHWTAGDRRMATLETQDGRATAGYLAAGRYRVTADGQRRETEDPAAFDVQGALTVVALSLPMPRRFHVRLRVYDPAGRFVLRGLKQSGGASSYSRSDDRPPSWVQRRTLRKGLLNRGYSAVGGCGCGGGRGGKVPIEAVDGTFDMLMVRESARNRSSSSTWYLHPEDGTTVSLHASSDEARDVTFVGVTLPLAELHAAIRLPDGTRAIDAGAKIEASCSAVLVPGTGVEPDWRALPIQVRVRLGGYADLDFTHTLAQPLDDRTLEPNAY